MKHKISNYNYITVYLLFFVFTVTLSGCKKYLDEKSDRHLVVPVTLQDVQAIMDNYGGLNNGYSSTGAVSDDDYYVADTYYSGALTVNQDLYIWKKDAVNDVDWSNMYKNVLYANLALETIEKIQETPSSKADRDRLIGTALFFRGYSFYHLAQYFAEPYDKNNAAAKPGIPLRLNSDVSTPNFRNSMEETYQQIIQDIKSAVSLLPVNSVQPSRPAKGAAYGALARVYLAMEQYTLAGKYADSALQIKNTLLNYNSFDVNATAPFTRFNAEVIFPGTIVPSLLSVTNFRADSVLYDSYNSNDLRKKLFFKTNGSGTAVYYTFKGSYDGTTAGSLFNGITVDEMYFIRAECFAREGDITSAMNDLNTVLASRWKTGITYNKYTASNAEDALTKVLLERRKELAGRALRWFDLRRLNKDTRYAKTLQRKINGTVFSLPPNDPRYTFYIPFSVIVLTGMQQNNR